MASRAYSGVGGKVKWRPCQAGVLDLRQDESISIEPFRIAGVETHEFIEHDMSGGSKAHGGSGMTGVGFEGGIDLSRMSWVSIEHKN